MTIDPSDSPAEKLRDQKTENTLADWMFHDRESAENRFGMELERVLELYNSDDGRKQLLEQMKDADPALNGNVEGALDQVSLNMEQLQKKEGFLKKMLKLPERSMKATWKVMKKHPVVSTLLLASLAAGGVAGGFYAAGEWELLMAKVGVTKIMGGLEAMREMLPFTAPTEALPSGGMFDVPTPFSAPGSGTMV